MQPFRGVAGLRRAAHKGDPPVPQRRQARNRLRNPGFVVRQHGKDARFVVVQAQQGHAQRQMPFHDFRVQRAHEKSARNGILFRQRVDFPGGRYAGIQKRISALAAHLLHQKEELRVVGRGIAANVVLRFAHHKKERTLLRGFAFPVRRVYKGTAPRALVDQAVLHQHVQRFAHRDALHAKGLAKFPFEGELAARRQLAALDFCLQIVVDHLILRHKATLGQAVRPLSLSRRAIYIRAGNSERA